MQELFTYDLGLVPIFKLSHKIETRCSLTVIVSEAGDSDRIISRSVEKFISKLKIKKSNVKIP